MQIKIKNKDGLVIPYKKDADNAAYDITATTHPLIVGRKVAEGIYANVDYIEYGTGLYIEPLNEIIDGKIQKYWLQVMPRSSISSYNMTMANVPIIDGNYRGEIKIRFKYIFNPDSFILSPFWDGEDQNWSVIGGYVDLNKCYKMGDRIGQAFPVPLREIDWILVDNLGETARNEGGFGSSGGNSIIQ
jgi:dUTPase